MKRFMLLAIVGTICVQPAFAQTAVEKAEKRLAELLMPGSRVPVLPAAVPVVWKASAVVENFEVAARPVAALPVRLSVKPLKDVKPGSAPEGVPLVSNREQPKGPKDVELPTKPLIKLPSVDVHAPLPIPILAKPVKDRASLGDPAMQASLDAAMKPISARRDRPVPFSPLNLPDPFENARQAELRNPPEENPMPPVIPLVKPSQAP